MVYDYTFGHRLKARGPFGSNDKVFCRSNDLSEDEGKRREAKTKAPTAKAKASEERRRSRRQRRRRRLAKRGEDQGANGEVEDSKEIQQESTAEPCEELRRKASGSERAGYREGQIHRMMMCVWAQWAGEARM